MEELAAREATITQLRDQIDKITADSIKKSTKIEDLPGDSSKKSAKVDDLRSQRTGLRNRLDEQAALHQAAVEEKDSEMALRTSPPCKPPRTRFARNERDSSCITAS